jgi:hypothetical protein
MRSDKERPQGETGAAGRSSQSAWRWIVNWMRRLDEALETTEIDFVQRRMNAIIEELARIRADVEHLKTQLNDRKSE